MERDAGIGEGPFDKGTHRRRLAGREHEVVRLVGLQDHPHAADIFAGMAPVALGIEIAEKQLLLAAELYRRCGARNLARHERLAAQRAFVVE